MTAALSLASGAVNGWYLAAFQDIVAGRYTLEVLNAVDGLDRAIVALEMLAMLAGGIAWMVWQYRVATNVPRPQAGASPAFHAWAWVIPFVNWVVPYQHISRLYRAGGGRPPGWLLGWWLAWIGSSVVDVVGIRILSILPGNEGVVAGVSMQALSDVIRLLAAVLAWMIVSELTRRWDVDSSMRH